MSELELMKMADEADEKLCADEIVLQQRETQKVFSKKIVKSNALRSKYKEFYDDIKLDISEDW